MSNNVVSNMVSYIKSFYEEEERYEVLLEHIKSLQSKVTEISTEINELKQKQVTYNELMERINNLQLEVNELKEHNKNNQFKNFCESDIYSVNPYNLVKKIMLKKQKGILNIGQVQVYNTSGINIANKGITEQSSLWPDPSSTLGPPHLAIDGLSTTFSCSADGINEWWSLTFNESIDVQSIIIHDRIDQTCYQGRLNGVTLHIYNSCNQEMKVYTLTSNLVQTFNTDK